MEEATGAFLAADLGAAFLVCLAIFLELVTGLAAAFLATGFLAGAFLAAAGLTALAFPVFLGAIVFDRLKIVQTIPRLWAIACLNG